MISFLGNFVDIWRFISGHTAQGLRKNVFANKLARRKTLKSASTKKLKGKKSVSILSSLLIRKQRRERRFVTSSIVVLH